MNCPNYAVSGLANTQELYDEMTRIVPTIAKGDIQVLYRQAGLEDAAGLPNVNTPSVTREAL